MDRKEEKLTFAYFFDHDVFLVPLVCLIFQRNPIFFILKYLILCDLDHRPKKDLLLLLLPLPALHKQGFASLAFWFVKSVRQRVALHMQKLLMN